MINYFALCTGGVRFKYFLSKAIFVNHDLKINIDIFATGKVIGFFLLFLSFQIFHFVSSLLSFLLDLFNLVHRVTFCSFHIEFYYNSNMITVEQKLYCKYSLRFKYIGIEIVYSIPNLKRNEMVIINIKL